MHSFSVSISSLISQVYYFPFLGFALRVQFKVFCIASVRCVCVCVCVCMCVCVSVRVWVCVCVCLLFYLGFVNYLGQSAVWWTCCLLRLSICLLAAVRLSLSLAQTFCFDRRGCQHQPFHFGLKLKPLCWKWWQVMEEEKVFLFIRDVPRDFLRNDLNLFSSSTFQMFSFSPDLFLKKQKIGFKWKLKRKHYQVSLNAWLLCTMERGCEWEREKGRGEREREW